MEPRSLSAAFHRIVCSSAVVWVPGSAPGPSFSGLALLSCPVWPSGMTVSVPSMRPPMAASCNSPTTSSSRRARSRRASISARNWSRNGPDRREHGQRWSSRDGPRGPPRPRACPAVGEQQRGQHRGREQLRFRRGDPQNADRELDDRVAACVHHHPGPGTVVTSTSPGAVRRAPGGCGRTARGRPSARRAAGAEHLVGAEDHVMAGLADVLRLILVPWAGRAVALDERADGLRVRAQLTAANGSTAASSSVGTWRRSAVAARRCIQVRAALGDQGDPAGGVFGALAGTSGRLLIVSGRGGSTRSPTLTCRPKTRLCAPGG